MRSYFDGMLRYFEFSGRSTRAQYWLFMLVETLLVCGALYLDVVVGGRRLDAGVTGLPVTLFLALVHAIPNWTVQVRRLHDIGRSGWWLLLNIVPFGGLVLLFWACRGSDEGDNAYGPPSGSTDTGPNREPAYAGRSTIPRQVRMGSSARTPSVGGDRSAPASGRFI